MGQLYGYVCDGCGVTVHGKIGGKFVHKDYLQIKGQATLQFANDYVFVSRFPNDEITICLTPGLSCLQRFIDNRRGAHEFKRRQALKAEAEQEESRRAIDGP